MFLYISLNVEKNYSRHIIQKEIQQNQVRDKHKSDKNIPKPREATSVAIRIGALPLRNSAGIKNICVCVHMCKYIYVRLYLYMYVSRT